MINFLRIKRIRQYLTKQATEILVLSLVISHLDYCNAILYGIADHELTKLQRIQNMCAKMVLQRRKFDSSKQALFDLHWLPIKYRINFKIVCYMYNCHTSRAPGYLKELLTPYAPSRTGMRSADRLDGCYVVPFNKRKTFCDRSFSTIGPKLWNVLPPYIRKSDNINTFKKNLKTYFFSDFNSMFL